MTAVELVRPGFLRRDNDECSSFDIEGGSLEWCDPDRWIGVSGGKMSRSLYSISSGTERTQSAFVDTHRSCRRQIFNGERLALGLFSDTPVICCHYP